MEILENADPRFHDGKFMGCRTEFDRNEKVVIATIMFQSSDQNRDTAKDLGYEITDNDDIKLEIICPAEFDDDIPTLEQLILDYEQWKKVIDTPDLEIICPEEFDDDIPEQLILDYEQCPDLYKGQKMEVPKRELSKILCEFFLPITDGRN